MLCWLSYGDYNHDWHDRRPYQIISSRWPVPGNLRPEAMSFDLEASIAAWRRPYEVHHSFSTDDIDELEESLRDRIEALTSAGMTERKAFELALKRVGTYDRAEIEYQKVYWGKLKRKNLLYDELIWRLNMLSNHFKIAFRNLRKQKGYAFINIAGLAFGLACSFFIFLWVQDELKHDRFLENGDRVHKVFRNVKTSVQTYTWDSAPKPLAGVLKERYPEITETTMLSWPRRFLLKQDENLFREGGRYGDKSFFTMFSFPFIQGDPETALQDEFSLVITDRVARKMFGDDWQRTHDVIGMQITVDHRKDFTITGVIEDIPDQSSIQFDVMISLEEFFIDNDWLDHWGNNALSIYAQLADGVSPADINPKIAGTINDFWNTEEVDVFVQPFEELYLYSNYRDGVQAGGRIEAVRIFSVVGIFLLIIACINFMNLATARSAQRAREIGVRKAIGANKKSLVFQFLGESTLVSFIALVIALMAVLVLLPYFNTLTNKYITLSDINALFFVVAFLITVLVGLLAGGYPALYLSGFNPLQVLRGPAKQKPGASYLRKGLVIVQFALSVLLIVGTVVVYLQIQLIKDRDLGLERENVIYVRQEGGLLDQYEAVRQELLNMPGIAQVTSSTTNPLEILSSSGDPEWDGKTPEDDYDFYIIGANYDFVETMQMELVAGRAFSREFGRDSVSFVVNQEMATIMGDDVIGKELSFWGKVGPVVGVVKNFEMNSMYNPTEPVLMHLDLDTRMLYVRTLPGQTAAAIASLRKVAGQFNPDYPLEYSFLDQEYAKTYHNEATLGQLAGVFAFIAIFVSCLGLIGLISFTTEQRTKEIGVRKVLGASVSSLVGLLTREITWLVVIGIIVALPVSYILVQHWLAEFEQRIETRGLVCL